MVGKDIIIVMKEHKEHKETKHKKKHIVSSFIVPWILKDDSRALERVKLADNESREHKEIPLGEKTIAALNAAKLPTDGYFPAHSKMAKISSTFSVFSKPDVVLDVHDKDHSRIVIMIDDYWDTLSDAAAKQFDTKLLVTMKAWHATLGYVITKNSGVYCVVYDKKKWREMKGVIKPWYKKNKDGFP